MSHEINSMAYAGSKPWHGLGVALPADAPLDVWAQCAGMRWQICESPVQYRVASASDPHYEAFKNYKVLFRSDTLAPLSVVSKDYHLVRWVTGDSSDPHFDSSRVRQHAARNTA